MQIQLIRDTNTLSAHPVQMKGSLFMIWKKYIYIFTLKSRVFLFSSTFLWYKTNSLQVKQNTVLHSGNRISIRISDSWAVTFFPSLFPVWKLFVDVFLQQTSRRNKQNWWNVPSDCSRTEVSTDRTWWISWCLYSEQVSRSISSGQKNILNYPEFLRSNVRQQVHLKLWKEPLKV